MYLKRIEIAGFKSFADRTTIEFGEGLTAVVGPNGSGKSNITEAIKWVLGEQSAKNLRGGKMPDVIFAGSSSRSPLNLAEVTLVLDNEDKFLPIEFTEVSVTRRLSRSGESDFFINKQACRLKDVVHLFMDSGLGRDSFSMISQGKVESIFNSKAEDRRAIFEEAAGVLKYKTRKKEAQRRLGETDDNLSRVQDIVYELEAQLEPLSQQSQTAKEYLSLKEQLKELDVSVSVNLIEEDKKKWQDNKKILLDNKKIVADNQATLKELEKSSEMLSISRGTLEDLLDAKQVELLEVTTKYEQYEAEKKVIEEKQKFSKQTKENQQAASKDLLVTKQRLEKELLELNNQKQEIEDTIKQNKQLIKTLIKEVERFSKSEKEQLEDLRSDYLEVMQKESHVNNDLKHLEKQYEREMSKSSRDNSVYDKLVKDLSQQKNQLLKTRTNLEDKTKEANDLTKSYKKTQQEHKEKKENATHMRVQLMDALRVLEQGQAKRKSIKDLQENYAGFYQGVQSILKEKNNLPGIIGAVAELVSIPEEYQLAIETALGAATQHIVVKDDKSAREAISYLKNKRLGRATFLPLTTIKSRQVRSDVLSSIKNHTGFIGVASDLVKFETTVSVIIQNLLGVTLVADTLDNATALAKKINFQYRVVSLSGDVMHPGGSMTGGMSKKGQSMHWFSQNKELKTLDKQLVQMTKLYEDKEQKLSEITKEVESLDKTLEQLREDGATSRLEAHELSSKIEHLEREIEQNEKERQSFEYEEKEKNHFLAIYKSDKEIFEQEKKRLEQEKERLDGLLAETGQRDLDNTDKKEEARAKLAQAESSGAVLLEKLTQVEKRLVEKEAEAADLTIKINALLNDTDVNNSDSNSLEEEKEQLIHSMEDLVGKKDGIQSSIYETRDKREGYGLSIKATEEKVFEARAQLDILLAKVTKCEIVKGRLEHTLDSQLVYLQEEYGLTFEAARDSTQEVIDVEDSLFKIREIKNTISNLGPVNTTSIAQYEEVNARYEFLVEQRDDLYRAKDELAETMDEMDELVITKLHEAFFDIRKEFREVFPKMFGGGRADLVLTDELDLLNTGIDIIAEPPGKTLQQLSLLSGGERALTAIALLFAIIQARPVPFCILDEVEAALDEVNVTRFGDYLNQFNKDTQFIVITHRKGTMEASDVLYGVTMQESGVSKLVSVRLEEMEKHTELFDSKGERDD